MSILYHRLHYQNHNAEFSCITQEEVTVAFGVRDEIVERKHEGKLWRDVMREISHEMVLYI